MLPPETLSAFFPPAREGGPLNLHPATLYHYVAMERVGVDLDKPLHKGNAYLVLWILCYDPWDVSNVIASNATPTSLRGRSPKQSTATIAFDKWLKRHTRRWLNPHFIAPQEAVSLANNALEEAFSTVLAPQTNSNTETLIKDGLGWCLELAEWYMSEYKASFEEACRIPLVRLCALKAAFLKRNGVPLQDSYEKRQSRPERLKRLRELNKNGK